MIHLVEIEKQQAWAALPRDERMLQGRLWYATRNAGDLHNGAPCTPCLDPQWQRKWIAKVRRSCAVMAALQIGRGDPAAEASAELAEAREEAAALRGQVDAAVELAAAQRRVAELSERLLADSGFARADTSPMPIPAPRAAS